MAMTISGISGVTFPDTSTQAKSAATDQTGLAPFYSTRAWVNFNGTGTVAINASGNVSSITDNGTGNYTINFSTAMPDANYAVMGWSKDSNNTGALPFVTAYSGSTMSSSACQVVNYEGTVLSDPPTIAVSFIR